MPATPTHINWDLTYACQLRCIHCYSQSGRRPSRDPGGEARMRIAEQIVAARPRSVAFAGGEPLLVDGVWALAAYLRAHGIQLQLYTNGLLVDATTAPRIAESFDAVHVSVDGADAATHDRIRGRHGAFDAAMRGLAALDQLGTVRFGIDATLMRSSFAQAPRLVRQLSRRFANLQFVRLGAVIPTGLASMPWMSQELLSAAQLQRCSDTTYLRRLRQLAPGHVDVSVHDNADLLDGPAGVVQVEPDGAVRALPVFEGTVGNLQWEPLGDLLPRQHAHARRPGVAGLLKHGRAGRLAWAESTRAIDVACGDASVRELILKRRAPRALGPIPLERTA